MFLRIKAIVKVDITYIEVFVCLCCILVNHKRLYLNVKSIEAHYGKHIKS